MTPVLYLGAPGVGKTARVVAEAQELGLPLLYLPLAERDPAEIAGVSYLAPRNAANPELGCIAAWAASEAWERACDEACVVLLDELTACSRMQRVAGLRYADPSAPLHKGTRIYATANPPEYAAGSGDALTAPELTRWRVRRIGPEASVDWMLQHESASVRGVAAYLRANMTAALASAEAMATAVDRQEPFPCPRTWTRFGLDDAHMDSVSEYVGDAAAVGYVQWMRTVDLPDPDAILRGEPYAPPTRGDAALATAAAIAARATADNVEYAIEWFQVAAAAGHVGVCSIEAGKLADRFKPAAREALKDGRWAAYRAVTRHK